MRTLYVSPITGKTIREDWGFSTPFFNDHLTYYIQSNVKGTFDLKRNSIYTLEELKGRQIYIHKN